MRIAMMQSEKQTQKLSLFQTQALQILEMDNIELKDYITKEYIENPLLEYTGERYHYITSSAEEMGVVPDERGISFRDELKMQISGLPERDKYYLSRFFECMDDDGFLPDLEDVRKYVKCSTEEFESYLFFIHNMEPAGIGASNVRECILIQLRRKGWNDPKLTELVNFHLEDIAFGKIDKICRKCSINREILEKFIYLIKETNPKPVGIKSNEKTQYFVPDIIIKNENQEWKISLNDSWIGEVTLNNCYDMKQIEKEDYFYMKNNYVRARNVINAVQQRRNTLLRVTEAIFKKQYDFFVKGAPLRALTMQEIADELGIHETTVSRSVKGKVIQFPAGSIVMKNLFVKKINANAKENSIVGREQIKRYISELIETEDKMHPLSDEQLAVKLQEKQIKIARRTVAKYREELGILGTTARRYVNSMKTIL